MWSRVRSPAEVLALLRSRSDVRYVRGNADRLVLRGRCRARTGLGGDAKRLGEDGVAELASWPLTLVLEVDGLGRVLFCHAVPSADEPIFTRITPDEEVAELIGGADAEVVVCGHLRYVQFDRRPPERDARSSTRGASAMPYEGRRGAFWALPRTGGRAAAHRVRHGARRSPRSAKRRGRPHGPARDVVARAARSGRDDGGTLQGVRAAAQWLVATSARRDPRPRAQARPDPLPIIERLALQHQDAEIALRFRKRPRATRLGDALGADDRREREPGDAGALPRSTAGPRITWPCRSRSSSATSTRPGSSGRRRSRSAARCGCSSRTSTAGCPGGLTSS